MEREQFQVFATRLRDLQDAGKETVAKLLEKAAAEGIDPAGLRRFVAWKRQDAERRAQQEAIDQQCRYLAGERDKPATLPIGCELAQAVNCFAKKMTVRQVAEALHVSVGKAQKLRNYARMFDVHVHSNVNAEPDHDPDTGEIIEDKEADVSGAHAGEPSEPSDPAEAERIPATVNPDPPPAANGPDTRDGREQQSGTRFTNGDCAKEISTKPNDDGPFEYDPRAEEIDTTLPPFLDQRKPVAA